MDLTQTNQTKGEDSMTTKIEITSYFAGDLRHAILDHQWCEKEQDYFNNPVGLKVRGVDTQAYEIADGSKKIGIPVTLAGRTIGDAQLSVKDALTLIKNLTNAVNNSL